jgi:DNA-binding transcriptional MerR regulator
MAPSLHPLATRASRAYLKPMTTFSIGQLAKAADVKIPTIRFYEQIGLLPHPERSSSARRLYEHEAIGRLRFIRHARELGFPTEAIRTLLDLAYNPQRTCEDANLLAAEQLQAVNEKIVRLQDLRDELQRMVAPNCIGLAADCRVIEALNAPIHYSTGESVPALLTEQDA